MALASTVSTSGLKWLSRISFAEEKKRSNVFYERRAPGCEFKLQSDADPFHRSQFGSMYVAARSELTQVERSSRLLAISQRLGDSETTEEELSEVSQGNKRLEKGTSNFGSRTEDFLAAVEDRERLIHDLEATIYKKEAEVLELQQKIDALYSASFAGIVAPVAAPGTTEVTDKRVFDEMSENMWRALGREDPALMRALIGAVGKPAWTSFQRDVHNLSLCRDRLKNEIKRAQLSLEEAKAIPETVPGEEEGGDADESDGVSQAGPGAKEANIVLISGFESFNVDLYKQAANIIRQKCPGIHVTVFSDRDLTPKRKEVEAALTKADVFFGSLIFDYDQVEWLRERIQHIPLRLSFESALELMSTTTIGTFTMGGTQKRGMPAPVKAILSKFGGGREEDKMVGYLSFLKIGPKLLRFIPGQKVRDLRNWLTVYGYWNQGGLENVVNMFIYLADQYILKIGLPMERVLETPGLGLCHPDYDGYFTSASQYLRWHRQSKPALREAPTVAVLLYRKHVVTRQQYIPRLIRMFEQRGLVPVPVFINGVEAHTVVRDLLTTEHEQAEIAKGRRAVSSLSREAVVVDAVVSTIGFPLVGGPAGTMEGGRQAEVAKAILMAKNIPYITAAPLLIQDITSWQRNGVQGLQSVVLYSLPELDGAIDAIPLGGLVGDGIHLVPERVRRLTSRLHSWISLRRKRPQERKLAVILYGFPPGVGATGTAALLNVPRSLEKLLSRLRREGYDLGGVPEDVNGDDLVSLLQELDADAVVNAGVKGPAKAVAAVAARLAAEGRKLPAGLAAEAQVVSGRELRDWLGDVMSAKMEKAWGQLIKYRGIRCDADGNSVISGIRLGNVWIGVQPLLGIEGDPMRLLFDRDLTPHPQYAAFYKWLDKSFQVDALIHFGMHGTVEWLPGSPLGNTALSWSDFLMGNAPNMYIYAANNPSESIVAKRRGYGTIVSYNVPPYGRAGLYKELASLREVISEYREDPEKNRDLQPVIAGLLISSGLQTDCPFAEARVEEEPVTLTEEMAATMDSATFSSYMARLYEYLQVVENRLFSEGLHVFGEPPEPDQMKQYLGAYFGDEISEPTLEAVARTPGGLAEVRRRLEDLLLQEGKPIIPGDSTAADAKMEEAIAIRDLLRLNTEEMDSLVKGLNGEYIPPAVGGDLLRDGAGVLPTGRNIHALDPYRMPSAAAWERGRKLAENIIEQHVQSHGSYPETVAVMLWGLDAIKTRGESVAIALGLVGAYPVKEGTGRVVRFELTPLEQLGRPRIDVLANLSGIFRDSFANVVDLLDDLFKRAAAADEPIEMNFIRKHALELEGEGLENASARIFSNPAGDYGSMVNERIGASDWENSAELGETWASRNSFSYGRGEQGVARPEVLKKLLTTTDRIVQEIDSVEYGLTDIQEYYANTGAMKSAAQTVRGGKKVNCSIVEAYGKDLKPRELESTLCLEYRSKLLNPKWAEKMAAQGSGGAYEISQRMTALLGWGGTADFKEDWVYNQAADRYVLDADMAGKLRKSNPQAFRNILKRMLEAAGRGLWNADEQIVKKLQDEFAELDNELEGVRMAV